MNAKTILKSTGKFFKDLWGYIEPHLNSVAGFLLHHKWWGIAGVFCLAVIPLFISFHYEKGLDTGNAIFFSIAIFIGACIVAVLSILALCLIGVIISGCIEYFKKSDDDTPDESSEKKAATELRPIDTATLEKYFKPSFRGTGGKFNQFKVLVDMLEGVRKKQIFLQQFSKIYQSAYFGNIDSASGCRFLYDVWFPKSAETKLPLTNKAYYPNISTI